MSEHNTDRQQKYKLFLKDLGPIVIERALEAVNRRKPFPRGSKEYEFHCGRILGFNEVISILQQQANAFGIDLREMGLDDINPDNDLI